MVSTGMYAIYASDVSFHLTLKIELAVLSKTSWKHALDLIHVKIFRYI
jgi:hypothetical protein